MIEIRSKLKVSRAAYNIEVKGRLTIERHGDHFHARLDSGEEAAFRFAQAEELRGGDLVTASDGRVLEVVASEPVRVEAGERQHHHHHHGDHKH